MGPTSWSSSLISVKMRKRSSQVVQCASCVPHSGGQSLQYWARSTHEPHVFFAVHEEQLKPSSSPPSRRVMQCAATSLCSLRCSESLALLRNAAYFSMRCSRPLYTSASRLRPMSSSTKRRSFSKFSAP